jgi:large subunit ribosomal protein L6
MSKIGKKYVFLEKDVKISFDPTANKVKVVGAFGTLVTFFLNIVKFKILKLKNNNIYIKIEINLNSKNSKKFVKSYHGLVRAILSNIIYGVKNGYTKILKMEGIGYKFEVSENDLIINAGHTHKHYISIPSDISVKLESSVKIILFGINKSSLNSYTYYIRAINPPEPYKGKGILLFNEQIKKKVGKRAK